MAFSVSRIIFNGSPEFMRKPPVGPAAAKKFRMLCAFGIFVYSAFFAALMVRAAAKNQNLPVSENMVRS